MKTWLCYADLDFFFFQFSMIAMSVCKTNKWINQKENTFIISWMSRRQPQNNIFSGYLGGLDIFGTNPFRICNEKNI